MPLEYAPRTQSVYSDLGFILLGFLLDDGATLSSRFDALRAQMAISEDLQFTPPLVWKARTAPTGHDPWRGRLLVGEVHDENAGALDGVAGHAGSSERPPQSDSARGTCCRFSMGRSAPFSEGPWRRS